MLYLVESNGIKKFYIKHFALPFDALHGHSRRKFDKEYIELMERAEKDAKKVSAAGFRDGVQVLLEIIADDPFGSPPHFEKLVGDLAGAWSRRINIQHRLVYQVLKEERTVKILRMWTHYE